MNSKIISTTDPMAVMNAVNVIQSGGLVVFPTDTVYGLAADPKNRKAIQRLFTVKGRQQTKAIAILIGSIDQLELTTSGMTQEAMRFARQFWPGALTLVVPRHPDLPEILGPLPTIGIRMPDHPFALTLLAATGPLATTSANLSGAPSTTTAIQVMEQLATRIDLILDGGEIPGGVPSSVIDCTGTHPVLLREGALTATMLGI